jgi:hypothetical protein
VQLRTHVGVLVDPRSPTAPVAMPEHQDRRTKTYMPTGGHRTGVSPSSWHAAYYAGLVESGATVRLGLLYAANMEALSREHANLRAALSGMLAHDETAAVCDTKSAANSTRLPRIWPSTLCMPSAAKSSIPGLVSSVSNTRQRSSTATRRVICPRVPPLSWAGTSPA